MDPMETFDWLMVASMAIFSVILAILGVAACVLVWQKVLA